MKRALLAAFLAMAPVLVPAQPAAPIRMQDFFRNAEFADMRLSPDGKLVGALVPHAGRQNLVVLELATRKPHAVTSFEARDVVWFHWINNRRLVLRTGALGARQSEARGGGLFSADVNGREVKQLSDGVDETLKQGQQVLRMLQFMRTLPGDGDDFIAQEMVIDHGGFTLGDVYRVNARTGRRALLTAGKPETSQIQQWIVDRDGVARVQVVYRGGASAIHYRAGPSAPWKKLDEVPITQPGWEPIAVAEDGKSLYITSWKERDKAGIRLLDPDAGGPGRLIASHPHVDVSRLIFDEGVPVGIAYEADRPGVAWFDEELERIQAAVNEALPGATNELSWSRGRARVLVRSSSDVSPGAFYLFDRASGKLEWFADRHPWIKRGALAPMRPVRYRARDGFDIGAYLTLPRDGAGKRHPMVLMVHGGPWTEGNRWRFDPEAQYLASLGYAVLQPNFRGTLRYGWKHLHASFRQWGRAMQDDLTDGVRWAIAQGYADPDRICIYGASYGGYAALMGAASTPKLFKCAISVAGISDLVTLLDSPWSIHARMEMGQFTMSELIGDPKRDADFLAAVSPRRLADRIEIPVMLVHGTEDVMVTIDQGEGMKSALEDRNKRLVWMPMAGEGHCMCGPENRARFYRALDDFLKENIGARVQ